MKADETEIRILAQQLRKNGIAKTDLDAKRMAEDMVSGSSKLSKSMNTFHENKEMTWNLAKKPQPTASPPSDAIHERLKALEEHMRQKHEHITQLSSKVEQLEKQLASIKPAGGFVDQPKTASRSDVAEEIVNIEKEQDAPDEAIANTSLEPTVAESPINSNTLKQELQIIEQRSEKDEEEYKEEQAEIAFIGEDVEKMEPKTREVPVTEQQRANRGKGLSEHEKKSADLSSMFNFSKK